MSTVMTKAINLKLVRNENERSEPEVEKEVVYDTKGLNLWYGETHALKNINMDIKEKEVTAIIEAVRVRKVNIFEDIEPYGGTGSNCKNIWSDNV